MNTLNIRLYDVARQKLKLNEDDAKEFAVAIEEATEHTNTDIATKDFVRKEISEAKVDIYKAISWASLIQILTIIGSIIALYKLLK